MKILNNVKFSDTVLDVTIASGQNQRNRADINADLVMGRNNRIWMTSGGGAQSDTPPADGGIKIPGKMEAAKVVASSGEFSNLSANGGSASLNSASITNLSLTSARSEYDSGWKYPESPIDGSKAMGNLTLKTSGIGRVYISGTSKTWSTSGNPAGWANEIAFEDDLIRVGITSGMITSSGEPPASGYTRYPEVEMLNAHFAGGVKIGDFYGGLAVEDSSTGSWFRLTLNNNGDGTATASWAQIKTV